MPQYTKLFSSIITSSIWTEDDKTRLIWITMLALADQNGEVYASIPGLARVSGVLVKDVEMALEKLLSPDGYSRTKDHEGRRIVEIPGGWELLNHAKYRKMASKADAQAANAARQKRWRERNASPLNVTERNAAVTDPRDIAEAEAEAEVGDSSASASESPTSPKPPPGAFPAGWRSWSSKRQKATRVGSNSDLMARIGGWFGRRPQTLWSVHEAGTLADVSPAAEELDLLEGYYLAVIPKDEDIRRRDLSTLLANWNSELDRARAWKAS